MEVKKLIYEFSFANMFSKSDKDTEVLEVEKFEEHIKKELNNHKYDWDGLTIRIRNRLIEHCKMVKRRTQKEEENTSDKVNKTKPLIHIHQEDILNRKVHELAKKDNDMLFDFLKYVQNMMRGRIFEAFHEMFAS